MKFRNIGLLAGISATTLALAGGAYAAQGRGMHPKIDTNGDGVITRAEAEAGATAMFARLDVNKDGKLDKSDRELHMQHMKTRMFERLDANSDGQISKAEFMADSGPADASRGAGMDGTAKDGYPHGREGGHGGFGHAGMMMRMAKMADTNHDGAITQAEFTATALRYFDAADVNHDGKVTKEERQAAREKMRAEWKQTGTRKTQG